MALYDPAHTLLGPHRTADEWSSLRYVDHDRHPPFVLGASLAGVICGVDKYKTALELYHEMLGQIEPRSANEAMYWGTALEEPILAAYEQRCHVHVERPHTLYLWKDDPRIGATPDGMGEDADGRYVVECKCASGFMFSREASRERDCFGEGQDEVPMSYLLQCHQQMLVLHCDRCDMPVLFDGRELRIYSIHRNEQLVTSLLSSLRDFASRLLNEEPPEPDFAHDSTTDFLKRMYDVSPGASMELPSTALPWYDQWQAAKVAEAAAIASKEQAQAHLLHVMQDCERCYIPEHEVELRRTQIQPSLWREEDILEAQRKLGSIKRNGYIRFSERKVKS